MSYSWRWLADMAERALWTAVQAFLATFSLTDLSTARTAGVAAGAAVLAVLKAAVAARVAGTISPASFAADR
jgi:hypothetical protein